MIYLVFSQWQENEANTTTPGQKSIYACFLINFLLAIIRTLHWCLSHFLLQKGNDGSPVFHYLHCYICTMSTRAIFVMYKNRERDYED